MPRFIDDLRTAGRCQMPWFIASNRESAWEIYARQIWELVKDPELPVLLIDNVASYYFTGSDQENWDIVKDFPNLAPPFPRFWCEHRLPKTISSKEKGSTDLAAITGGGSGRVGMLATALDPAQCDGEGIPENVRWVLWCDVFIQYTHDMEIQGPHGAAFFAIDEHGALVGAPWMQSYGASEYNNTLRHLMVWFHPMLLAISFLHCKNVKMQEERADKPLAKKYHAKTGNWPVKYKTLVIEPLKEILRTQGRSGEVGLRKAMHICRGHFADYTQGAGLFGKYHGRFWIPATVRGTKRKGEPAPPAREIEIKL